MTLFYKTKNVGCNINYDVDITRGNIANGFRCYHGSRKWTSDMYEEEIDALEEEQSMIWKRKIDNLESLWHGGVIHEDSRELELYSHKWYHCFELEPKFGTNRMEESFCSAEWAFGTTKRRWTYKINTPTTKLVNEWESNVHIWMREYLKCCVLEFI